MRLIGRRRELETLAGLLDRVVAGTGGHLILTGPPGSGRTAVLRAATQLARDRGIPVSALGSGAETDRIDGPRLLLWDDVERSAEDAAAADAAGSADVAEAVRAVLRRVEGTATVLVATAAEPLGLPPELCLTGLAEPELAALLPKLSADAVRAVWLASAGLPGVALGLANLLGDRDRDSAGDPADDDPVIRLALTLPARTQFLELDTGLIRLLETTLTRASGPGVRARVLARLARELLGDQSAAVRRRRLVDEAAALAEAAGDPGILAEVLDGRLHALWDPAAAQERLSTSARIVELSRTAGDVELEVRGLFWRFTALTELGDLATAEAALAAYARAGEEAGLALSGIVALSRQAMLAIVRGRFEAASALVEDVARRGLRAGLSDTDRLVASLRDQLGRLRGEPVGRLEPLQQLARRLPGHYYEATAARRLAESGREVEAGLELERLLPAVLAGSGPRWLGAAADLAIVAAQVGDRHAAKALYGALLPYRGRLVVWGGANTVTGPVDGYLGRLAAGLDEPELALTHLDTAVDLSERLGALPWLADLLAARAALPCAPDAAGDLRRARSIADRLGLRSGSDGAAAASAEPPTPDALSTLDASPTTNTSAAPEVPGAPNAWATPVASAVREVPATSEVSATPEWSMRRDGEDWLLEAGRERVRLRDGRGPRHLRALLAAPGQEIAALDLMADGGPGLPTPSADAILDDTARHAFRRRLDVLAQQLDAADRAGDADRAAAAAAEREAVLTQLRGATGLGGRARTHSDEAERARVNVTRALWATVRKVETSAPLLGAHLRASLRTGRMCRYHPAPCSPQRWRV